MDLLDLFVKVGVKDEASEHVGKISEGVKNVLGGAAKAAGVAIGAASAAVGALGKQAVESYAEYEQLIGGVETLFGKSADTVQQYAQDAYQSAGMSANEYMQTITSFSASLLQGLGGDTAAAAEVGNRAVQDMSDNANKFGTNISSIQNAYQGFAKQNYTMLDNLKLGYGGTKEEMQRLIEDASKMTDVQEKLGITVDASSMSFDNIVNAISIVQSSMGVMGTTAAEAGSTISGSLGSMKAAWQNLLTGLADGEQSTGELMNNLIDSALQFGENIIPVVEETLSGIGDLVEGLAPIIGEKVPQILSDVLPDLLGAATALVESLASGVFSNLPTLLDAGIQALLSIVTGITEGIPSAIPTIVDVVLTIAQTILDNLPTIISAAIQLVQALISGILEAIPLLAEKVPQLVTTVVAVIRDNLPMIIESAFEIITTLIGAIIEDLPMLMEAALGIVSTVAEYIVDNIPLLVESAIELVNNLIDYILSHLPEVIEMTLTIMQTIALGLIEYIPQLIDAALQIVKGLLEYIMTHGPEIIATGLEMILSLVKGIVQALPNIIQAGKDAIAEFAKGLDIKQALNWGRDLISNFISGIKEKWEHLKDTISDVAETVKDFLGFSEPEKGPLSNFHTYGPDMMKLYAEGIRDNMWMVGDALKEIPTPSINVNKSFIDEEKSIIHNYIEIGGQPLLDFVNDGLGAMA